MIATGTIFLLLVLYQVKHFLADYPLQGKYMLGKFKGGNDWIAPLLAHVGVHGIFTLVIGAWFLEPSQCGWAYLIAFFDMCIHFSMDRIKASPEMMGRWKALSASEMRNILSYEKTIGLDKFKATLRNNTYFWWALGFDQMVHHLTHYCCIYLMLAVKGLA